VTVISRLVAIGASAIAIFAFAGENLYRVNSKDVGYGSIDLTISEVKRDGRVSVLHIPHYETRSSVESRFAMCAFTDIAIQRGFEAWVVSNKRADDDLVRVGFLKSEADDVAKVLGKEFVGGTAYIAPVNAINRMCGITRRK
jgi:hypothetical protein